MPPNRGTVPLASTTPKTAPDTAPRPGGAIANQYREREAQIRPRYEISGLAFPQFKVVTPSIPHRVFRSANP
jgi:hypothetical protein